MKSKKFTFYYFLFVLSVTALLIGAIFLLKDIEPVGVGWFGPALIPFVILANPIYTGWVVVSFLLFIISHFINKEQAIRFLNWILLLSPFLLIGLFRFMILFNSGKL